MDATERYEKLAKEFYRETGLMAPGKDAPASVAEDPEYQHEYRKQEWDKWMKARQKRRKE